MIKMKIVTQPKFKIRNKKFASVKLYKYLIIGRRKIRLWRVA